MYITFKRILLFQKNPNLHQIRKKEISRLTERNIPTRMISDIILKVNVFATRAGGSFNDYRYESSNSKPISRCVLVCGFHFRFGKAMHLLLLSINSK